MLESIDQTVGTFNGRANLYRFRMYTRIAPSKHFEALEWGGGSIWTPNSSKANPGPTRAQHEPVRDLPKNPDKKELDHHFYVFARRAGEVESTFLFDVKARHMSLASLPTETGRDRWQFAILALPHRLTPNGIAQIQSRGSHVLRYREIGEDPKLQDGLGLEVVFPYMVARSMARQIRANKRKIERLTAGPAMYAGGQADAVDAYKDYRLAEVIHELLQDNDLSHDLSDAIGKGTSGKVARIVHDTRADISRFARTSEQIAADLVAWYGSELFKIIVDECRIETPGVDQMIEELGYLTEVLRETTAGCARLAAYAQGKYPDSFLHKGYVSVPAEGTATFKKARHSVKVSVNIFNAIHTSDAILGHTSAATYLAKLESWVSAVVVGKPWKSGAVSLSRTVSHTGAAARGGKSLVRLSATLEGFRLSPKTIAAMEKVTEHTDLIVKAFDEINTALALYAVFDASANDTSVLTDKKITAGTSLLSFAGKVLKENVDQIPSKLGKAGAKAVTNLGSLWFAYKNYSAATAASDVGDSDAAAVMYVAMGTEVLSFMLAVGGVFAAEGSLAAASLGPVGAVLGMIGGVCYLVYDTVKDSELALAVSYTEYGSMPPDEVPQVVGWCPVSPKTMKVSREEAIVGIEYGLRQFTLGTGDRPQEQELKTLFLPRVYVGHVDGSTQFHVEWDCVAKGTPLKKIEIWSPSGDKDANGHTTRAYGPNLRIDRDTGEFYFDAALPPGFATISGGDFHGFARVRKTFLETNERRAIPHSGAVELELYTTMTTAGKTRIRSSSIVPKKPVSP